MYAHHVLNQNLTILVMSKLSNRANVLGLSNRGERDEEKVDCFSVSAGPIRYRKLSAYYTSFLQIRASMQPYFECATLFSFIIFKLMQQVSW